jgi:hypothetical protein
VGTPSGIWGCARRTEGDARLGVPLICPRHGTPGDAMPNDDCQGGPIADRRKRPAVFLEEVDKSIVPSVALLARAVPGPRAVSVLGLDREDDSLRAFVLDDPPTRDSALAVRRVGSGLVKRHVERSITVLRRNFPESSIKGTITVVYDIRILMTDEVHTHHAFAHGRSYDERPCQYTSA